LSLSSFFGRLIISNTNFRRTSSAPIVVAGMVGREHRHNIQHRRVDRAVAHGEESRFFIDFVHLVLQFGVLRCSIASFLVYIFYDSNDIQSRSDDQLQNGYFLGSAFARRVQVLLGIADICMLENFRAGLTRGEFIRKAQGESKIL